MKKQLIAITAFFLLVFPSLAFGASTNFGVAGALATVDASGTETTSAGDSGTANTNSGQTNNANIFIGSVYAEFESDWNAFTLGVEWTPGTADVSDNVKTRTDTETSVTGTTAASDSSREFKAQAEVENFMQTYAEVNVVDNLFIRASIAQIDVNTTETKSSNGGSYGNDTLDGVGYGVGFKGDLAFGNNLGYKLYYENINFDTLSLTSTETV